ncbi:MAG: hypothetical protein JO372_21455, partial [Solirubrobacterales bacterium]|nr:hypothetical protein [Solirubrobacterales bacterium]
PHNGWLRVGDQETIDGVRGTGRAQVSVPQVELIDRSEDRVAFRIWLRIWYLADPGTAPMPEFSHGVLRAEYGLQIKHVPQSPQTPRGGAYGFLGVIPGTVSFHSVGGAGSTDAEIAKQLEPVLTKRYEISPQPMLDDFAHRRFLSLTAGAQPAIAHPLQLDSGRVLGDVASIKQVFLAGSDFAVAVSREYIMSLLDPPLAELRATSTTFDVNVTIGIKPVAHTFTATYTVSIDTASADWSAGTITLHIAGTAKNTSNDFWAPDHADFSVDQDLILGFDPATETLSVSAAGPASVSATVSGIFGPLVKSRAEDSVRSQFNTQLASALAQIAPHLHNATGQKQKLIDQLKTLDAAAGAKLQAAEFNGDGMILRGAVSVAPRLPPEHLFAKLADQTGYTAYYSWAPGGRIDELHWRWEFDLDPAPPPGNQTHKDTFLLRSATGLPGLAPPPASKFPARAGRVCLALKGVQVDVVSGADVPFDTTLDFQCVYFVP